MPDIIICLIPSPGTTVQTRIAILQASTDREVLDGLLSDPVLQFLQSGDVARPVHLDEVRQVGDGRPLVQLRTRQVLGPQHQGNPEVLPSNLHSISAVV